MGERTDTIKEMASRYAVRYGPKLTAFSVGLTIGYFGVKGSYTLGRSLVDYIDSLPKEGLVQLLKNPNEASLSKEDITTLGKMVSLLSGWSALAVSIPLGGTAAGGLTGYKVEEKYSDDLPNIDYLGACATLGVMFGAGAAILQELPQLF